MLKNEKPALDPSRLGTWSQCCPWVYLHKKSRPWSWKMTQTLLGSYLPQLTCTSWRDSKGSWIGDRHRATNLKKIDSLNFLHLSDVQPSLFQNIPNRCQLQSYCWMQKAGQCNFLHRQEKKKKEIEPRNHLMCKYIKESKICPFHLWRKMSLCTHRRRI